ncbi:MAG TPA: transglutaminase family protein [Verrucomicrobiae bacterium]|jgi:transglutaminase-like putative cysteine protease|nr:transglutaminase family protein [Verrucomicrobiae bacterium]
MKWEIIHRTEYLYASPVSESFNEVRLHPVSDESQHVNDFLLKILPATRLRHHPDFYSNIVHHFEIPEPHTTLLIESLLHVTTRPQPSLPETETPFPLARISEAARAPRVFDFLQESRFVDLSPQTWRYALDAAHEAADTWQAALAIMRFVHAHVKYESKSTHVYTHMSDVLRERRGVCQDFAHVMIGLCRSLKIPALYVSGYLATEIASATHAWTEVLIPGIGWRGLDPTHNRQANDNYVKIAVGRDYADVPPVTGNYKGTTDRKMSVSVKIKSVGSVSTH